jgi:uncharacterized protein YukE
MNSRRWVSDEFMTSGDPAAMRAEASRLRSDAERIRSTARTVAARVDAMIDTGPAATRFRRSMRTEVDALTRGAEGFEQVADILVRSASMVEGEQARATAINPPVADRTFRTGGGHADPC